MGEGKSGSQGAARSMTEFGRLRGQLAGSEEGRADRSMEGSVCPGVERWGLKMAWSGLEGVGKA